LYSVVVRARLANTYNGEAEHSCILPNCRITLRYIQQLTGEHTSRYNPENPPGFYELYINGAQPRR